MKKMFMLICAALLLLSSCYYRGEYSSGEYSSSEENNNPGESLSNDGNKDDVDTTNSGSDNLLDPNIKPITAERLEDVDSNLIYSIGDSFKHKGFTYTANSVKSLDDSKLFNKNNIPDSPFFENGGLLDGYVGIILNITVINNQDVNKELYINTYKICSISDKGRYRNEYRAQICAYLCDKDYHPSTNSKSYYKCVFSPNEKVTFDILYIIEKDALESNLDVVINDYGFSGYADEDVRFIKIN